MCEAKSFYLWLLQIVGLLGLLALCLWLSIRPNDPTFTIVEFSVPPISRQNSSATGDDAFEDDTLSFTLEIKNPNKESSVYYNDIFLIFYLAHDSVKKTIPSFHQKKGKSIQDRNHVDDDEKILSVLAKAISNGHAEVKVDLSTAIQYKTWGIRSKHRVINLQATIPLGSDGKISGKKKKIKLHNTSKKWKLRDKRFL